MLVEMFEAILFTSLMGTLFAFILILLKPITEKHCSGRWHYFIWLAVFAVMMLPIRISLSEEYMGFRKSEAVAAVSEMNERPNPKWFVKSTLPESTKEVEKEEIHNYLGKLNVFVESGMKNLSFMWFAVTVALLFAKIAGYIVFLDRVHNDSEEIKCPELINFTSKNIAVRLSNSTHSPIMMGILKPVLVLPRVELSKEQLNNILAHEITHLKRNDILCKWFATIVKCIHWFNPMVYFINKQINVWCEISCDLAVVERMDRKEQLGYIDTILALLSAGRSKNIPFITAGMLGDKKTLQRRFLMIKNRAKLSRRSKIVSSVAAAILLLVVLCTSGVMASDILDDDNMSAEMTAAAPAVYEEIQPVQSEESLPVNSDETGENIVAEGEKQEIDIVWPCPSSSSISNTYGTRVHPITGEELSHNGIDIVAEKGVDIVAAIAGRVTGAGFDAQKGNYVVIAGDNGIEIIFAHLLEISVTEGEEVAAGQCVGKVGSTGMSTGPHVHFEALVNGESVDPQTFFEN